MAKIDLNSDLGEQKDSLLDEQIMPFISSCNIACGGHAGDADSYKRTLALAIKNEVAIGAHPGFPDPDNFGRVIMEITPEELTESLEKQIVLAKELTEEAGEKLHHVKPHGALYNLASIDEATSRLIIEVVKKVAPEAQLYCLSHSITYQLAEEAGLNQVGEAFADRRYVVGRTLMSRKFDNAVIHSEPEVLRQVEQLVFDHEVQAGTHRLKIDAKTICLHSDTKGAVNLAKSIHDHLVAKGATIAAV